MGLDLSHSIPSKEQDIDLLYIEDFYQFPHFLERHKHLFVERDYGDEKATVIFLKHLGEQRKGMNRHFYNDFPDDIYLNIEAVKKAYKYLEASRFITLEELQKNFQENFIDNFVEGESIFWISR